MAKVMVLGARGILGRHVADIASGKHVVIRAGRTGLEGVRVDLRNGAGLEQVDADVVVHCAAAPFTRLERMVEAGAMAAIAEALPDARILYPSIVGIDRMQTFRYYRTKLAAEKALAATGADHCIVRFTQFHEFADRFARMPIPVFPRHFSFQSLAACEAAAELVRRIEDGSDGLVGDFGGPEVIPLAKMVKDRLRADGRRRPIVPLPMGRFSRQLKQGLNQCPDAAYGRTTWAHHLTATRPPS